MRWYKMGHDMRGYRRNGRQEARLGRNSNIVHVHYVFKPAYTCPFTINLLWMNYDDTKRMHQEKERGLDPVARTVIVHVRYAQLGYGR